MAFTGAETDPVDSGTFTLPCCGDEPPGHSIGTVSSRAPRPRKRLLVVVAMAFFPTVYMWPVLNLNTRSHLQSPRADTAMLTDLDGAIWLARAIRSMPWLWSHSMVTAVPSGESIWRWQALTQALQVTSLWMLTRVFEPALSVNLFVLLGWIVTGIGGYVLARTLGAAMVPSLGAGLLCQMLPSMPTMAANYTSYVFIGAPLLVLAAAIVATTEPTWRRVAVVVVGLAITAMFDPYWFFFSMAMVLVAGAVNARALLSWFCQRRLVARVVLLVGLAVPVVLVGLVVAVDRLAPTGSRPLEIASAGFVDAGLRRPTDWFRWSYEGVGLVIPVIAVAYTIHALRRNRDRRLVALVAVGATMVALSTRTRFGLGFTEIGSLAEYARFAMPGVRFFQRAALIADAVMCVLASLALREVGRRPSSVVQQRLVGAAGFGLLIASLAVWNGRAVFEPPPTYSAVRQMLSETADSVVATLPADRVGRAWFELSLLDVPTVNSIGSAGPGRTVEMAADQGAGALAAHLKSLGTTHLFVVDGDDGFPLQYSLDPPRFVPRMSFPVSGFERLPMTVTVYEVNSLAGDEFCEPCAALLQADLSGDNYPLEELSPRNKAWWMFGSNSELSLHTDDQPSDVNVRIRLGNTPCGRPVSVEVTNGSTRRVVRLVGQETAEIDLPVDAPTLGLPIEISVDGEACEIDGDDRRFTVQIFQPEFVRDR